MRVTLPLKYDRIVNDLNRKSSELSQLSSNVSSGKRLLRPSDDPLGWVQSMSIKRGLQEMDTFQSNIDYAVHWHRTAENALDQLSEVYIVAKETAISAMGAPSGEATHAHMQQLDQLFQQALSIANTRHENRFLFAMNNNESPFSLEQGDQILLHGPKGALGPGNSIEVRIGYGLSQAVGLDGKSLFYVGDSGDSENAFTAAEAPGSIPSGDVNINGHNVSFTGGGDALSTVLGFVDAVNNDAAFRASGITASVDEMDPDHPKITLTAEDGRAISLTNGTTDVGLLGFTAETSKASVHEPGSLQVLLDLKEAVSRGDTDEITQQMENLEKILENLRSRTSLVGNRLAALDARQSALEGISLEERIRLSDLEDADMLSTISLLQAKSTAFEAALKATGLLNGLNLTHYI